METNGDLAKLTSAVVDALVGLRPERRDEAVAELVPLYAENMVFRDPVQVVRGRDAFAAMNRRLLGRMRKLTWEIASTAIGDDLIFLEWTMRGAPKLGPSLEVEGTTRLRVRDGLITDHRDYWDLGELTTSAVPGGQWLLHTLLKPFA